jgi:bifunctional pyridoxal-dependent enzyme with beta-cystathionase and maltose regulon repressor activities
MVEQQFNIKMDFDKIVDRKNTNSYKWDKYPEDVLPLWVADMDFEVAEPIKKALGRIIDHGVIGYSRTPDELVEVVLERIKDKHHWEIQKEWIVWLPGLVPGLHTAARCISDDYISVMIGGRWILRKCRKPSIRVPNCTCFVILIIRTEEFFQKRN